MRELWHVVAAHNAETPLYSAAVSVESDDPTVTAPVVALQVACDGLLAGGLDPRTVTVWHLARQDPADASGLNG